MGTYINPTDDAFAGIVADEYVDKTGLIALVNEAVGTPRKLVCVSRPRRFGKSFAAESLVAYYGCARDGHALFDGLALSRHPSFERHLGAYHVVRLDMTSFTDAYGARVVEPVAQALIDDAREDFPDAPASDQLTATLLGVVRTTHRKFVFVIDEWDAPFREDPDDWQAQERYVKLLRSLFKNGNFTSEAIAAAYMTGILPIKKYGTQSALNDFQEFTMVSPAWFGPYVGFTEAEVKTLCQRHGMDFAELQRWYDGYDLPGVGPVYAPNSTIQACRRHQIGSYWTNSETYDSLRSYIDMDFDGLQDRIARMVAGDDEPVNTLGFQNDMVSMRRADDVLTLLVHLGYLAYDTESQTVRVPNEEVRMEFARVLRDGGHPEIVRLVRAADQLLDATIAGDEEAVAAGVAAAHDSAVGPDWYNDEQALRFAVKLAYLTAVDQYARIEELPSGHGRADLVYLPKRRSKLPALVIELKWDKAGNKALRQIRERDYPAVLRDYGGPIVLVGITYDASSKAHTCHIERVTRSGNTSRGERHQFRPY